MTSPAKLRQLEELLIKQRLHELVVEYSSAADRCDEAALRELFHPDGLMDSGVLRGTPEFFAREFAKWVHSFARVTFHAVTNQRFHVSGTEATGEAYVVAVAQLIEPGEDGKPAGRDVLTFGRYIDRFQERQGVWKFLERRFELRHQMAWPASSASR
ncbi:MAG TPA: nuclear transport factor 2 family protein [Steroidobacteraceae bacterium]|nr:nuclear transport factor 2 family protein [Steroidobacteraceae bacterium]